MYGVGPFLRHLRLWAHATQPLSVHLVFEIIDLISPPLVYTCLPLSNRVDLLSAHLTQGHHVYTEA